MASLLAINTAVRDHGFVASLLPMQQAVKPAADYLSAWSGLFYNDLGILQTKQFPVSGVCRTAAPAALTFNPR